MKAQCPHCGYYAPVEGFLDSEDAKRAAALVDGLPGDLPRLVWSYMGLFRKPSSPRVMTWSRVHRLASEIRDLALAETIQWKGGRVLDNSPQFWAGAITTVLDRDAQGRIERPLEGHNYVRAIAYELAEKRFEGAHRDKEAAASRRQATSELSSEPVPESRGDGERPMSAAEALEKTRQNLQGWRERLGGSNG